MIDSQQLPRGIRNNNPLNLRISDNQWLGKVQKNTDGAFEQFTSMTLGIRAAMVNARTIVRRNAGCTVQKLIETWAPASDGNNVRRYVEVVCEWANVQPSTKINWRYKTQFCNIMAAMAFVETGILFKDKIFSDAYDMLL